MKNIINRIIIIFLILKLFEILFFFFSNILDDQSVDIWSLGCVIYSCLTGSYAFDDDYKAVFGYYNFDDECWQNISLEAQDFIRSMIQVDPSKRASINDLLQHPWLVNELVDYKRQHLRRQREKEAEANPPEEAKDPYDNFGYWH